MDSDTATGACTQRHYFVSEHERRSTHEANEAAAATVEGRVLAAITKREHLLTELRGTYMRCVSFVSIAYGSHMYQS